MPEDFLKENVPVNVRAYLSLFAGRKEPLTETFFAQEDLEFLRRAVERKVAKTGMGIGALDYDDYSDDGSVSPPGRDFAMGNMGPLKMLAASRGSPAFRMETTLGMARYEIDDAGNAIIEDRYNFGATRKQVDDVLEQKGLLGIFTWAYQNNGLPGLLNAAGNLWGATDEEPGIVVRLNLGPLKRRP